MTPKQRRKEHEAWLRKVARKRARESRPNHQRLVADQSRWRFEPTKAQVVVECPTSAWLDQFTSAPTNYVISVVWEKGKRKPKAYEAPLAGLRELSLLERLAAAASG